MMSSATGIARNDHVSADSETNNGEAASRRRVSYGRATLLSMAEAEACKNLPCGFDLSIFCEVIDHDSTGSPRSTLDSDCCKKERQRSPSQSLTEDPESGTSGTPLVLEEDDAMIGTLATSIEGSSCALLSRCVDPYQPPSLRKVTSDSDREYRDSRKNSILGLWTPPILNRINEESRTKDSPGWMARRKAFQDKQQCRTELKEAFAPEIISMVLPESRNSESTVNKCKHTKERLIPTRKSAQHNLSLESSEFKDLLSGEEMDQSQHWSTCEVEAGGQITSGEEGEGDIHPAFSEKVNSRLSSVISLQLHAHAKSRVPQPVLLCPDIEKNNQLEEIEHDVHEELWKQSCDMGSNHSLSWSYPEVSKQLLSVLTKDRESEDLEDPVADALSLKTSETMVTRDWRKDVSSPSESDQTEELHSMESIARAVSALTEDDFLGFVEFSYPDLEDIIATTPDEIFAPSGEFSMPSSSSSQTGSDLSRSVSDDVPTEFGILPGGKEMKLSSEGELFYNVDEIFLPDEDSLITLDDLIMSMELVEKPDVKSGKEQLASSISTDIVDNASQPRLGSRCSSLGTKKASLCISYDNPGAKTTSPVLDHSPRTAENPLSQSWRNTLKNHEVKCSDPKTYSSDRPLYLGFPATKIPDPFLEPYAMPTQIGGPAMNTLFPEMAIPGQQYPLHLGGLVSGIPPSPMQHDPLHSCWQTYGLDMNGARDLASRITAPANWLLYMGAEADRMNLGYPWSLTP